MRNATHCIAHVQAVTFEHRERGAPTPLVFNRTGAATSRKALATYAMRCKHSLVVAGSRNRCRSGEVLRVDKVDPVMVSTLADAPPPRTVSPAAQEALRGIGNNPPPDDLEVHRQMCARVQRELGAVQLERHRVRMDEAEIAGVPVRIFTPADLPATNRGSVLLNLHGGGFN